MPTYEASTFTLYDLSDSTKKMRFNCSTLPTATTATLFIPAIAAPALAATNAAQGWTQGLQTYRTSTWKITDPSDPTKTLVFDLANTVAGADLTLDYRTDADRSLIWLLYGTGNLSFSWTGTGGRTLTLPDVTSTLAALGLAQTFSALQKIDLGTTPSDGLMFDMADPSSAGQRDSHAIVLRGTSYDTVAHQVDWKIFNDITTNAGGSTFRIQYRIDGGAYITWLQITQAGVVTLSGGLALGTSFLTNTTSSGAAFIDNSDNTKKLRHVLSGLAASTNNSLTFTGSATRDWKLEDVTGSLAIAGNNTGVVGTGEMGRVNKTAQTADIASTNLTNTTPAGMYSVEAVLEDTTSDVTAGTVTLTVSWSDDAGATTSSITQTLVTAGRQTLSLPLYLASGNVTYATTHTGIFGSAQYALRIRAVFLG